MSLSVISKPRYRVFMNGELMEGVSDVWVTLPLCFRLGEFGITKVFVPGESFSPQWWSTADTRQMLVSIQFSTDGITYKQIIIGRIDSYRYDPVHNFISACGRDLGAGFCDKRISGTYRNQTASEIAANLASEHGLETNILEAGGLVGRYYETDHDEIQSGKFASSASEWDLLCRLGSQESIVPYVSQNTLYFNPRSSTPPIFSIDVFKNSFGILASNASDFQLERYMTVADDVLVTVRSWHSKSKCTYSSTVRASENNVQSKRNMQTNTYLVIEPNLVQAQCREKAQRLATEYCRHGRSLVAQFPSVIFLTPDTEIAVNGTSTDYDMLYFLQEVSYSIDFKGGASTSIRANSSSVPYLYDEDSDLAIS